jgi:hypothetical protein
MSDFLLDLGDIYGERTFLAPRLMEEAEGHIPGNRGTWEFTTGLFLTVAGKMPMIAHRSVSSKAARALIRKGGLRYPENDLRYETREEYILNVCKKARAGYKAAFVYSHGSTLFGTVVPVVENSVLEYLNNKKNLRNIAPETASLPILTKKQVLSWTNGFRHIPVVAKLATNSPNGGGMGVRICRRRRDVRAAARKFSKHGECYFEKFVETHENWCVQFAIMPDTSIKYLGSTEQICSVNGAHVGSKITVDKVPPVGMHEIGVSICLSACRAGYKGIVGIDFLTTSGQRPYVVDINFRPVASTAFLLNASTLLKPDGFRVSRLAFGSFNGSISEFGSSFSDLIDQRSLVVMCVSAIEASANKDRTLLLHFALQGEDIGSVDGTIKEADRRGLAIAGSNIST